MMAGHGGARRGAGNKRGNKTRVSHKLSERQRVHVLKSSITPFDVMMRTIRWWDRELNKLEAEIRTKIPEWDSMAQLMVEPEGPVKEFRDGMKEILAVSVVAAPYVHPHVKPMEAPSSLGARDLSKLTDKELNELERITRKVADAYGRGDGEASS